MFRSPAKSRKATTTKLLKEKWERSEQSTDEKGENEVRGFSTITVPLCSQNKTGEHVLDSILCQLPNAPITHSIHKDS